MIIDIKVPSPGESITEVQIANWLANNGDFVEKDQDIVEIESDKATLTVVAEYSGKIEILFNNGDVVKVGQIIAKIDSSVIEETNSKRQYKSESKDIISFEKQIIKEQNILITPLAKKIAEYNNLTDENLKKIDGKIDKEKVLSLINKINPPHRQTERKKLSMLRKKISERLVWVKNQTAMLTTFNEVDMTNINNIRKKYKDLFYEKHGVKLGFMSFFTKAATESLSKFPEVNAYIENDEIIYHKYCDIGIAVQTDKGLMVPVLRNTELMTIDAIEKNISELAEKGRSGKISIDELTGGTFTISNGGVFGSLLSTPILNPPQSAILGMHNIVERPVAINGKVEIRPMMYIALSYDHRIIDGRDSVGFLLNIKNILENFEFEL